MQVRYDGFPLDVAIASPDVTGPINPYTRASNRVGRVPDARVLVADGRIAVAVDSPDGPVILLREEVAEFQAPTASLYGSATTASGVRVAFQRAAGCACGSRMKSVSQAKIMGYPGNSGPRSISSSRD